MNISGLIRSFIGDTQAAEPKKLELKVGQVVKGAVQQLLPNDEAMLNIGGVQVRAKLETPLKQGDVTLLQVQPETSGGQVVLKPLDASGVQIADSSLPEVLKNVGLPDTITNRQLVQALHQAGIPLVKETVQAFVQLQSQMPGSVKQEEWLPSAIISFQKGVPLTPESVSAIKQAIAGPAFHETLQQLDAQMTNLLTASSSLSDSTRKVIDAFRQVLASMKESSYQVLQQPEGAVLSQETSDGPGAVTPKLLASGGLEGQLEQPEAKPGIGETLLGASARTNQPRQPGMSQVNGSLSTGDMGNTVESGQAQTPGSTVSFARGGIVSMLPDSIAGGLEKAPATTEASSISISAEGARSLTATRIPEGKVVNASFEGQRAVPNPLSSVQGDTFKQSNAPSSASASADITGAAAEFSESSRTVFENTATAATTQHGQVTTNAGNQEPWISRLVKALGIEHESQLFKLPESGKNQAIQADFNGDPARTVQSGSSEQAKMADTLKSALLQLIQADDIPASLKDTAQQAVHHITGQQLMLNSDKSSMFSHITLFVPLMNANGEQTAAIHIQSRKGKRGEIDAHNCRLVFDLKMKTLGDTMVDVQVVDRIVSLNVHNNQPYIQQLLETHREDIATSLSGIGYQFISVKCSPYPEKGQESSSSDKSDKNDFSALSFPLQSGYGSKSYKGMDVRI